MRRRCWHYLCYLHLPPGYRANTIVNTVCLVCHTFGRDEKKAAGYVGHHGQYVQDGRRLLSSVQRHSTDSSRSCPIRMLESRRLDCWALTRVKVGLNFMTYESVRKYLTPEGEKNPPAMRKLAAGAISGAVAQTCTYPLYGSLPSSSHYVY